MLIEGLTFMFVSSFMALFPVANPIGSGFIVNGFLSGLEDDERKSIIKKIIINFLLIGIGSLIIGHLVLTLFNLSLSVIQLGGGLLICKTALQWLADSDSSTSASTPNKAVTTVNIKTLESQIFYPITFPISIGPGSISVIFTLMASASIKDNIMKSMINYVVIAVVICLMSLILYVFLSQGQRIMKKLGTAGNMIINKMVAFFTFCVGIQIVVSGISKVFHIDVL